MYSALTEQVLVGFRTVYIIKDVTSPFLILVLQFLGT